MKKIYFNKINYLLECDKFYYNIFFNDPIIYRNYINDLKDIVTISENNILLDFDKNCFLIYNLFQLDVNDKKIVNCLYKKLINNVSEKEKELVGKIEEASVNFFDELSYKACINLSYDEEIDLKKLFAMFNLMFCDNSKNYLEKLVNYLKYTNEIFNYSFVFTFGLNNLLSLDEIEKLKDELKYLNIILINISFSSTNVKCDYLIDDDWCIM